MTGTTTRGLPTLGDLAWAPALEHPDLVAPPVAVALRSWSAADDRVAAEVAVAAIDPDHADTATLNEVHGLPPETSANCVVVAGRRGDHAPGVEVVPGLGLPEAGRSEC